MSKELEQTPTHHRQSMDIEAMQVRIQQNPGFLRSLLVLFATHKIAANLLMFLLILLGGLALDRLNTQFFPDFELDIVLVQVDWPGASAEDVEQAISRPLEEALQSVNAIEQIFSDARRGTAQLRLEVEEGASLGRVLDEVQQAVDNVRTLPAEAERPSVSQITRYEDIATLLLTSSGPLSELRPWVDQMEQSLLQAGIRRVTVRGLPEEEILIEVSIAQLHRLGLTLEQLTQLIRARSQDLPAGIAARKDGAIEIRGLNQQKSAREFMQIPLLQDAQGRLLLLGDIATIKQQAQEDALLIQHQGRAAVELILERTSADDTLAMAEIMQTWVAQTRPTLPPSLELLVYNERWQFLQDRIRLLVNNGLGGLILVILVLFLFLNVRVAWWVAVGIPVSLLATLVVLWVIGGSINMISLFGLIMALGIIVDDAIVVGEDTMAHLQQGESAGQAALGGAQRMLVPVVSSSLTTIAAFLPLFLVGGTIGNILVDIPTIVVCVLIASLVECFLILPGHLYHSFERGKHRVASPWRQKFETGFARLREVHFRPLVRWAIAKRHLTLTLAVCSLLIAIALVAGRHVKFTFFPTVEGDRIDVNVQFMAGTALEDVQNFMQHLQQSLHQADQPTQVVDQVVTYLRQANFMGGSGLTRGDEVASMSLALIGSEQRTISNAELIRRWREQMQLAPGLEKLAIEQQRTGPAGKAIEIKLSGQEVEQLKALSLEIQQALADYAGVSNIDDDLPWGKQQWVYELTPMGKALGLDAAQVGRQLRYALEGQRVQIFYQGTQEIEVRIRLREQESDYLANLAALPIRLADGTSVPLANVVHFTPRRGLDLLRRIDGELAIVVSADVDEAVTNANAVIEQLEQGLLARLRASYPVDIGYEGRSADQQKTAQDMKTGLLLGLSLIWLILAWVFASYTWPFAVMAAIPFGLAGAIFGHLLMGLDLTILSLFGLFGLSGIVINDSIVLISFYKQLREAGVPVYEAIEEAAVQRFRAVLLTSLTTIAGLAPIMLETSLQARFLIPMATSIVFGLAYGTLLILLVVPAVLVMLEGKKAHSVTPQKALPLGQT
ncbi:Multidrug efflux pump subunit AcrB [Allopseudospirillum japonicum]|uniref:Multidrug efflux pump subunit AcrB n=1 Tax=Allopseudospirillum japonicum TaxID=64971 RepID=A0A1H6S3Z9_9GAMM|nr:efflux RND transporter permease subunit [Allopseudospirillum japonicum]SEI59517.1 Multidrug efflux pump subunit AcrB [Allopseudospirillum japonicum]